MKRNIWIINQYAIPPKFGGLNRHFYFSKYLKRKGYNVKIFTSSKIHNSNINLIKKTEKISYKEMFFDDVEYTFLKASDYENNGFSRIKNMIGFAVKLPHFFLKKGIKVFKKPDVIYTSSPSLFIAVASIFLATKLRVPIITEVRDLWPESIVCYKNYSPRHPFIQILYALEKWVYKRSNSLIFTMKGAKNYLKERKIKIDSNKIYHINNGVDIEEFEEKKITKKIKDKDLLEKNTFKIIYTGSIREVNNLDILLELAKKIKTVYKDIRFLIYGEGSEKSKLIKRCQDENINNVLFKGHISRDCIPFVLSNSDINIIIVKQTSITRFGSSLNKFFDYMASEKPIVSNLKVNYDLLKHYSCGMTSDSSSPEDLQKTIEKIRKSSEEEKEKMRQGAARGARDYDYKFLTNKLEKVIKSL
ncbi:MAG: glycosyltransferase family 4 protein [Oscillospiraceae bacterium]|nr:glycosyltransferase family 4 protein [Oscillospiraceae bacterium]